MRAIITVIGPDRVGIIAEICTLLAKFNVNVIDLNQTIMENFFTMTVLVNIGEANVTFDTIRDALIAKGEEMGLSIRIQREDIFTAMHQI